MDNPFTVVKAGIKNYVVNKGLQEAQSKIDTAPEREQVTRVIIDNLHLPGLPKKYAWVLALATAAIGSILDTLASSDTSLLVTNWKLYLKFFLIAVVSKFFLWMRQNTTNGIAVVEAATITKINDKLTEDK